MSVRRSLIVLTILTLVLPVAVFWVSSQQQAAAVVDQMQTMAAMQTHNVQRGTVLVTIPAVGSIEPEEVAQLSFLVSGQVQDILVEEGYYVEAGEPLVQLKNRAQMIEYEQANLNHESAVRQYEDLLVIDEDDIALAEANLQAARSAYNGIASMVSSDDIAAAELRYQQALTALEGAEEARNEASPSLNEENRTLLEARVGEASFNAEAARLQLEELRRSNQGELGAAAARIRQAEREVERARAGANEFELQQAQIAIEQAEAQLDQAQLAYERTILNAPFAGVVSKVNVEVGQRVQSGVPVVQFVNINPINLTGEVDEIDLRQVTEGQPAFVEMDALPNVILDATVERLAPSGQSVNGLVSYKIDLQLDTLDDRIRPGMSAEANIIVQRLDEVLAVPNRFVQLDRENNSFYVNILMPDGTLQPREVAVGLRGDDQTEIISGLSAGDVVAFMPVERTTTNPFGG